MTRKKLRPAPLAEAVSKALPAAPKNDDAGNQDSPPAPPAEDIKIAVSTDETNLVRSFVNEQINALPPSQRAVMGRTFNAFMDRCWVLPAPAAPAAPETPQA